MSAFLIAHSTVKDPVKFQAYAQAVGPTLKPYGGQVTLRGKVAGVLHGDHGLQAVGVLTFPDVDSLTRWYHSAEYQALVGNRNEAAQMVLIAYEAPPQ